MANSSKRPCLPSIRDLFPDELNQHPVFPVPSSRASSRSHSALTSGPPKSQQYPPHYPPIPTDTPSAPRPLTTGPVHPSRRLPPHEQSLRISSQWQNPSFRQEHFASYSPPQLQAYHAAAPGGPEPAKHPCTFCSKTFSRPSSLKTHLNSHTGEKPFVCPVITCGRGFSVLSNMRRHLRTHAEE